MKNDKEKSELDKTLEVDFRNIMRYLRIGKTEIPDEKVERAIESCIEVSKHYARKKVSECKESLERVASAVNALVSGTSRGNILIQFYEDEGFARIFDNEEYRCDIYCRNMSDHLNRDDLDTDFESLGLERTIWEETDFGWECHIRKQKAACSH